jgi:hypothetical protein
MTKMHLWQYLPQANARKSQYLTSKLFEKKIYFVVFIANNVFLTFSSVTKFVLVE